MATLILLQGGEATPYPLVEPEITLGRHPDCTIQLKSNMVSRRHARVTRKDSSYFIEDMGSGNGTFLNGNRLEEPTALKDGDRVKFGPLLFRFETSYSKRKPEMDIGRGETVQAFSLDIAQGDNDIATIMGAVDFDGAGITTLDVKPQAKLDAVLEINRSLAGTVDLEVLLPKILDTLFKIFPHADRGCILMTEEDSSEMVPRAIKHSKDSNDESVKLSQTILKKVLDERTGILSADASSDLRFQGSESISNLTIRSMMCVPLLGLDEEPLGVINIDTQNPITQFKTEDLDLLMAVASQAAQCYDTARLATSFAEKQKQDSEMNIAREVQRALLPTTFPPHPSYEFFASYEAAQAVGGDYYDVIFLEDDKVCLAFGDVAGKGVPASLVMSRLASVVRSTMELTGDIQKAFKHINNHMSVKAVEGRFVTFVLTILDLKTNEMILVNGGHMSPMIRKIDGTIEEFDEETIGLPVGVLADYPFETVSKKLDPGDIVVIYTDGVSEAMNPADELYGPQRLTKLVAENNSSAAELGKTILDDVRRHAAGRPQNDDITLMAFGRNNE